MPASDTRERLVAAAFALFARQGFDATTVDQIAAEAGVGRTTFFRAFPTKEAVVFPAHEPMLGAVDARLASASASTFPLALIEASAIVLDHYVGEADVARARYALTRSIPALRAAEIANQRDYQRLFRDHARRWGLDDLDAELLGNGVVTAHNFVLRRWLRGESDRPRDELAAALDRLRPRRGGDEGETQVVVLRTPRALESVVDDLRRLLDRPDGNNPRP